jgi:hypothetical protein
MVQFKILSGKMAGSESDARRFPFRIGRSAKSDLRLEGDGVWDDHLEIDFDPASGIVLRAQGSALTSVNGKPCSEAVLRNGDELDIGAIKLRFWMGATKQKGLAFREWLTWAGLALVTAGQFFVIYQCLP